ncbi:MAG: peptide chain release factor N(5)-glutamine methyltransferase [Pirellulaceae bacterium]
MEIRMSPEERPASERDAGERNEVEQPWTVGRLLTWTTDFLERRGSESAGLDAQVLLAHARKCQRIELFTAYDEEASAAVRAEFRELVRRRAEGTPVAYLVGHREFYSFDFQVTPDVLVPRPETEELVMAAIDVVKETAGEDASPVIADVGTGSGVVGICLAKQLSGARVWATDISQAALEIARRNRDMNDVADRVELLCGNLLAPVPEEIWFDLIVCNPPYVTTAEYAQLARDVRDHEPYQALVAGERGTEIIERLIPQAARKLKTGGWLLIEISPMIERAVYELLASDGRFATPTSVRDLAGNARVVKAAVTVHGQ